MVLPVQSRVFISCGQSTRDEQEIAYELGRRLETEFGFDVYVAVDQHSPSGLQEDIFRHIQNSEYYLMIDFRRERLVDSTIAPAATDTEFRGSLYTNQELAIAAFLGIKLIVFQEQGVRRHEGMLGAMHANPLHFESRTGLVDFVVSRLRAEGWESGWRNELAVTPVADLSPPEGHYLGRFHRHEKARYYLGSLHNLSRHVSATNCRVFVESYRKFPDGPEIEPPLVELKFRALTSESVTIPPGRSRDFDMMHLFVSEPRNGWLGFNELLLDSSEPIEKYILRGPGRFEVNYVVYCNEFAPYRFNALLKL